MKVKDLINLLTQLNPETELCYNTGNQNGVQLSNNIEIVEQAYSSYYGCCVPLKQIEQEISFREKRVSTCTARKNSNEYKDAVSALERVKNANKIPAYMLTYKK